MPALSIQVIYQDHFGFLWFGTANGLARYDGYSFNTYQLDSSEANPAADKSITAIIEDPEHNLWLGTDRDGIFRLDRKSNAVTRFSCNGDSKSISSNKIRYLHLDTYNLLWIVYQDSLLDCLDINTGLMQKYRHNPNDPTSLSSNQIKIWNYRGRWNVVLTEDHQGDIWIGTRRAGVNRFNRKTGHFTRFQPDDSDARSLYPQEIHQIFEDSEQNIWIATAGSGIYLYLPESNSFRQLKHDSANPTSIMNDTCFQIIEDNEKNLWLGTPRGLESYNLKTRKFTHFFHEPNDIHSIGPDWTFPICEDKNGWIWSKSHNGSMGINDVLNPKSKKALHFYFDAGDPQSIHLYYFHSFCQDHSGILWFGCQYLGLNKINIFAQNFTHFRGDLKQDNGLPSNRINSLAQFKSYPNDVWVGMEQGIYVYNFRTRKFNVLPQQLHDKNGHKIVHVNAMIQDKNNVIWIAAYLSGLIRLEANKPLKCYAHNPNDPLSLSENYVQRLLLDHTGKIWISTQLGGLNYLDPKTEIFTRFIHNPNDSTSVSDNLAFSLFEDSRQTIWVGTWRGLDKFIPKSQTFKRFFKETPIYCMHEDDQKNLWIGTIYKGLIKFNLETEQAIIFTTADGLPDNTVSIIIEDDAGYLWLATNGGLCRFNPETNEFVNLYREHGLPTLYLSESALKRQNGEIWLGTWFDGIVAFDPKEIKLNPIPPKMTITDIRLFDKSVKPGANSPLKDDITVTREIRFEHWQNDLSIEMTALHYAHPERNRYQYWLENYDEKWRDNGTDRLVTYTNLDPGEYIFHTKGANSDGFWNEEPISLRIIIYPPWWATLWAYLFYGLAFVATLYGGWRFQLHRINLRNELKMQKFESQKLKEVDTMKSRFFANISHEFRTPITLILGPLEKWIAKITDAEAQKDFSLMRRNVQRLHRLINQLLDLSRIEAGKMELHPTTEDLVRLVNHYVQSFESQAKLKEVQLLFESRESHLLAQVDREKMENIIYNLISNALKFTPKNGKITVSVNSASGLNAPPNTPARIEIKVSDTGIGIPTDRLDKIFDRFYQVDDSYVREHEGSGIGLALTKELVELHSGEIFVNSAPGVGSVFTVLLPVGDVQEAAGSGEITADFAPKDADGSEPMLKCPESTPQKDNPLVLIVEDNADLRTYIGEILQSNYRLIEAADGVDGYFQAQEKVPDLIISDVMMPKMDGFQLCAKLKTDEITSHIPIILLTARATKASKLEGLETGADDYLIKPFDAEELQVRIKNLITQRRQLRTRFSQKLLVEPHEIAVTSADERFLQWALNLIEENMADPEFNAEEFSRRIGLSRSQLHRKLDALTGQSTTEFIRAIRLKRAASLIKQGFGNISEIAFEVGFNHLSYFTECFRKEFGVNPKDYV